ncbi:MAG: ribosome-associated translation inhibitor RaiA [Lactobacillales bacterium]|jgi:ribosomal subunit interface protein|nr:ribosome-associated translation inhibitor RaiA [Lactobacillales bacterium]
MQTIITGQHIDLGDSLRSYVEKAIETAVSKYFEDAVDAEVHFIKEKSQIKAEISVRTAKGTIIRTTATTTDPYASFDEAVAKISRQLRKYKNKLVDHKNRVIHMAPMSVINVADTEEVSEAPVIIAELQAEVPTCTVGDAVMQMDLEGLTALLFKNSAHGGLNMVYLRPDGNIGWIDPSKK